MATYTVTTSSDVSTDDGETTLREAIDLANAAEGADQIIFDSALAGGATVRLTQGELLITDEVTIDGGGAITVTGDANGDDALVAGTDITDLAATALGELDDNSRVLRIDVEYSTATALLGLTITGGRNDTSGIYGEAARPNGGGGIYATGELTLEDVTLAGNSVDGPFAGGGGLVGDTVSISNSRISGNRTEGDDGAGGGLGASTLTLTGSEIVSNSTLGRNADGGGLIAGFVDISASTFADNSAVGDYSSGGGLRVGLGSLSNITVSGNFAKRGGGVNAYRIDVTNSIILGNASNALDSDDAGGYLQRISNSIIGAGAFTGGGAISANPADVFAETVLQNGVPKGVLGDNGGGLTIALRSAVNNPALDAVAGDQGVATDQRGAPGSVDLSDVDNGGPRDLGAFELQADEFLENRDPIDPPSVRNAPTAGPDFFFGGAEDNTIFGRRGGDALNGNSGADVIRGGGGEDTLNGGDGADTMAGGSSSDFLIGGSGSDELVGGRGDDELKGGRGADRMLGLAGDDTIRGGEGRDLLLGGLGDDLIQGADGSDRLFGGDGDDTITGHGTFDDGAIDIIVGGAGDDQLSGFGGTRTEFVFRDGDGSDEVFSFEQGIDKIRVLGGAETFDDLTIVRDQENVIIRFADVQITVDDQRLIDFGEDDFLF